MGAPKSGSVKRRSKPRKKQRRSKNLGALKGEPRRGLAGTKAHDDGGLRLTPNGHQILAFMQRAGVRGNWKDYVLFVGVQMLDAWGTYQFKRSEQPADGLPADTVGVLHKRKLHRVIPDDAAALFWNRRLGRRTNYGQTNPTPPKDRGAA